MIGDILRQEREKQMLTVKDIEKGTSIRALYIEAIENGEYETLPGEVYTKGFIRNYANFLKMDADDCVQRYVSENHPGQEVARSQTAVDLRNHREEGKGKGFSSSATIPSGSSRSSGSGYGMIAAVIALVAVLGGGAYFLLGNDSGTASGTTAKRVQQEKKQTVKTSEKSPVAAAPASPVQAEKKAAESKPAGSAGKKAADVQVTAKFTGRCWTKVVADGQTVYEGTAEQGRTMSWKGNENVTITAGNAGAVELTCNGKPLGRAGEFGQVVDKVFTRDSVN